MRRKIVNFLTITTLTLSVILTSSPVDSKTNSMEMAYLKKYKSDEMILLRDRPIQIPKYIEEKKEEFRGTWISTVYNIDFPSKKGLTQEEYKEEYMRLLDNLEALNINSVIFQVRPKLDAFYKSSINPWSEFLTGVQGQDPGWDPLEWMIEETHSRAMEFQAWFNPYRVTTGKEELSELAPNNWARQNPEGVFNFNDRIYLNPGEPKVIKYINDSIMEVVENYDIDGVHFDDYFYPSRSMKDKDKFYTEEEKITFQKYGKGFKNVSDWRRNNVDQLVLTIHNSITEYNEKNNKSVQFGISPFGIWGHRELHPLGSKEGTGSLTPITSQGTYDNLFADTRKWVKNNWVDYIAPQIYWTFDEKVAPYGELVNWWADVVKDTKVHLYIGHANYRKADINNKNLSWQNPEEISNQLKFNSLYEEIKGSIFFSYKSLLKNEANPMANNEFIQTLKKEHFNEISLLPAKPWLSHKDIESPSDLEITKADNGNLLTWHDTMDNTSSYYVIYRREFEEGTEKTEPKILDKTRRVNNGVFFVYIDENIEPNKNYIYSITAIDRSNKESEVCNQK